VRACTRACMSREIIYGEAAHTALFHPLSPKLCVAMARAGLNLPVSIFRLLRAFRVLRIFGCALRVIWLLPVCGMTRQRANMEWRREPARPSASLALERCETTPRSAIGLGVSASKQALT
jgi:hypothetical protein